MILTILHLPCTQKEWYLTKNPINRLALPGFSTSVIPLIKVVISILLAGETPFACLSLYYYQYCNKYLSSRLVLKYLTLAVIETNWSIKPYKWSLVSVAIVLSSTKLLRNYIVTKVSNFRFQNRPKKKTHKKALVASRGAVGNRPPHPGLLTENRKVRCLKIIKSSGFHCKSRKLGFISSSRDSRLHLLQWNLMVFCYFWYRQGNSYCKR